MHVQPSNKSNIILIIVLFDFISFPSTHIIMLKLFCFWSLKPKSIRICAVKSFSLLFFYQNTLILKWIWDYRFSLKRKVSALWFMLLPSLLRLSNFRAQIKRRVIKIIRRCTHKQTCRFCSSNIGFFLSNSRNNILYTEFGHFFLNFKYFSDFNILLYGLSVRSMAFLEK